jgi:hypothetical protein
MENGAVVRTGGAVSKVRRGSEARQRENIEIKPDESD